MARFERHIEVAANGAILIVCCFIGLLLYKSYGKQQFTAQKSPIKIGQQIKITGIDFLKSDKTLILAISTNCHYCAESIPFYQRVSQQMEHPRVRLVAVFPQNVSESKAYVSSEGLVLDDTVQAGLSNVGVIGTPTILLVNSSGAVAGVWIGKLTPRQEQEVLSAIHA